MQPRAEPDWRQAPGATRGLLSGPSRGPATPLPCWRRARHCTSVTPITAVTGASPASACASWAPGALCLGFPLQPRSGAQGTGAHRRAELRLEAPAALPSPAAVPESQSHPTPGRVTCLGLPAWGDCRGLGRGAVWVPCTPKNPVAPMPCRVRGSGCPEEVSWGMPGSEGLLSSCPSFGVCSGEIPSCKEPSAPTSAGSPSSPQKGALILVARCAAPWWLIAVSPAEDYSLKQERSSRSR